MHVSFFSTLLFVRTALVYGSEYQQHQQPSPPPRLTPTIPTIEVIPLTQHNRNDQQNGSGSVQGSDTHSADQSMPTTETDQPVGQPPYQTRLSQDTFEWLKTVTLVIQPQSDHNEQTTLHSWDTGTQEDNLVQNALGAWAAAIKSPIRWQRDATLIARKDIVRSRQEIGRLLGPVIVWKDMLDRPRIHHLIIRQVDSDVYEWMDVYQPDPEYVIHLDKPVPEARLELRPMGRFIVQFMEQWRFMADGSDGKYLTEICSTFAEQRIQEWQCSLEEVIREIQSQEGPITPKLKEFLEIRKGRLYSLFEDLQGIRRREREKLARGGEIPRELANEQLRNKERELQRERLHHESLLKEVEGQLDESKANVTQMIARLEAARIHEENLGNQRAETQQQLDQIAGAKKQMEEQLQKAEAERSSMIAHLENQESRSAEAQRQLEECQRAVADSEQEFDRKEKDTNRWILMAELIGGAVMLLVIWIFIFVLCRKAGKGMINTSEEMKRKLGAQRQRRHPLPNGQPGSVAIDIAEMDPQFRCSRDPQVAALRHSILADDDGQFGFNQIDEVTEQEGIDVSAATRQSTIGNAEEGESVIQAIKEGVKGAVERKQRRQMYVEPLKEMVQNAVVVQEEVIDQIVEVMETDKVPESQTVVNQ